MLWAHEHEKTAGSVKIRGFGDIAPKFAQFEVIFMIAISSTYIRPFIFAISENKPS